MATQSEAAAACKISERRFAKLVADGVIERMPKGQYDPDVCLTQYIKNLQEQAAGRAGSGGLDLTDERARKAKEEADKLEMENARRRGELIERAAVDDAVINAFARVRARLLNVPARVAPVAAPLTDPREIHAQIEGAIHEALQELSEGQVVELAADGS